MELTVPLDLLGIAGSIAEYFFIGAKRRSKQFTGTVALSILCYTASAALKLSHLLNETQVATTLAAAGAILGLFALGLSAYHRSGLSQEVDMVLAKRPIPFSAQGLAFLGALSITGGALLLTYQNQWGLAGCAGGVAFIAAALIKYLER